MFPFSRDHFKFVPMNFSADEHKVKIPKQRSSNYETAPELLGR